MTLEDYRAPDPPRVPKHPADFFATAVLVFFFVVCIAFFSIISVFFVVHKWMGWK